MGRRPKWTFLQRKHTDGQEAHEKMFNISNYSRTTNQNYKEMSPDTSQNGQQKIQTTNAGEGVERRQSSCTVGGSVN